MTHYVITHLTSAHSRFDTRIYLKMCSSLAKKKIAVRLIVADDKGNERINNVDISDVGKGKGGRINRMTSTTFRILLRAIKLKSDVYHMHDPELIPVGLILKLMNKKVIFDAHEDLPKQILSKQYLSKPMQFVLSVLATLVEFCSLRFYDGIIGATPAISAKLKKYNKNTQTINNFPILNELGDPERNRDRQTEPYVAYVGGISKIRGIEELVSAMSQISDVSLKIAGEFSDNNLRKSLGKLNDFSNVELLGHMSRSQVKTLLSRCVAGIVTFLPYPNHVEAQPNKMFEYMSAGIPIIASHFPMWKEIVEGNNCGICVNPSDPDDIARAIKFLSDHPDLCQEMGNNGRQAVVNKYNWGVEEANLVRFYEGML